VSFNVPYPASYGGVIDIFYKLKALHECGVKIILHTFLRRRSQADELNDFCEEVHYYKRDVGMMSQLTLLPFIVCSRKHKDLFNNLQKNDYPILFEGLHTCYYLDHPRFRNRLKIVRMHNIEHVYYSGLSRNSDSLCRKVYMFIESLRLKRFEKRLKFADYILPVSTTEAGYFHHLYGDEKVVLVQLFHSNEQVEISKNYKSFVLFHGDLSTPENIKIAVMLIEKVIKKDPRIPWVMAGMNPDESIYKAAHEVSNVEIRPNLGKSDLLKLIKEASINVLVTNQTSGVKLKLINALFNGHYCIANKKMLDGSGLGSLCIRTLGKPGVLLEKIQEYLYKDFPETEIAERKSLLARLYNNRTNAQKIIDLLT
jgi:glycosyltransferase involved in cell wall biosynthesis